jgi:hypothetical protein
MPGDTATPGDAATPGNSSAPEDISTPEDEPPTAISNFGLPITRGIGEGSPGNPHLIPDADTLLDIMANIKISGTYQYNHHYKLTENIDMTGKPATPIGNANINSNAFTGLFDGNYHVISGLEIRTTETNEHAGLFGYTDDATIKNLGIIITTIEAAQGCAGGVVGYADGNGSGSITNCYVTGGLTAEVVANTGTSAYAGGIVGASKTDVTNCYSTVNVTASTAAGGIVGYARGNNPIKMCAALNNKITSALGGRVLGGTSASAN